MAEEVKVPESGPRGRPISLSVSEVPLIERKLKALGIQVTPQLVEEIERLMVEIGRTVSEKGVKSYDRLVEEIISARVDELEAEISKAVDKEEIGRLVSIMEALKRILVDKNLREVIINHIIYGVLNQVFDLIVAGKYDEAKKLVERYNLYYDSLSESGKNLIMSIFTKASLLNQAVIVAIFRPSVLRIGTKGRTLQELAESYARDILRGVIPDGDRVYPLLIELLPKEDVVQLVKEYVSVGGSGDVQKDVQSAIIKHILKDEWDKVKLVYISLKDQVDWNKIFDYVVRNLLRFVDNIWSVVNKLKSINPEFKLGDDTMLLICNYLIASGKDRQLLDPNLVSVLTDDQKVRVLRELVRHGRSDLILQFLDVAGPVPDAEKVNIINSLLAKGAAVDDILLIAEKLGTLSDSQKVEIFKQLVPAGRLSLDYPVAKEFVKRWNLDLTKVPKDHLNAYILSAAFFEDFDEALYFVTAPTLFGWLLNPSTNMAGAKLYEQAFDLATRENIQIPLDIQLEMLEHFHKKGDTRRVAEIGRQIKLPRSMVESIPHELFQYINQIV
jgi:hypothetical protein